MNGDTPHQPFQPTLKHRHNGKPNGYVNGVKAGDDGGEMKKKVNGGGLFQNAYFMKWRAGDVLGVVKYHPIPCVFAAFLLFFMAVEYTLLMIPPSSPPFDLGFVATVSLHRLLASRPLLNSLLAGLNTIIIVD
ncbi:unnamed protein product [Ilex paraguariensis]|uniref:AtPDCT1/2 transmembrane domain-containing protein n=1 Tax=Ilex paraguariensis TaxID=185542 RepID=A0ABC8T642_9AQUA